MKNKIRWAIYKLIGYPDDVRNLLDYIDSFDSDICIYPGGEFKFGVRMADGSNVEYLTFPTPQERAAFGAGLHHGIKTMGGTSQFLTDNDLSRHEEMDKYTPTHTNPKKVH